MAAAAASWLNSLKSAQKTALVQDNRRKIHYTFKDGREMSEEYDVRTNELVIRRWREKTKLGGGSVWLYEVGEQLAPKNLETEGLAESMSNVRTQNQRSNIRLQYLVFNNCSIYNLQPILVRRDTKKSLQWRVRNLPYPLITYDVKVDEEEQKIIVRTSNKKYYKKIEVPDLRRLNIPLHQQHISVAHANNTLIITYEKPKELLAFEAEVLEELKKLKTMKDGDVDCKQS
ncbi:protein DPCD-like isoform X1 [Tubulanus polymorphus]|uniref:protein DPCD-like isoform X1 n=1 Tax=Tubulanus polymorphus TaxID=672921 RepID=UPI003DA57CB8